MRGNGQGLWIAIYTVPLFYTVSCLGDLLNTQAWQTSPCSPLASADEQKNTDGLQEIKTFTPINFNLIATCQTARLWYVGWYRNICAQVIIPKLNVDALFVVEMI